MYALPIVAVVALLGSVWIAKAAGVWQTSGRDEILLDDNGQADPAGIKGWMTLSDVSETYGVPQDVLYVMIGAGAGVPADTALKDLETLVPDFEVFAVREGVAAYLDGTWTPAQGRYGSEEALPQTAEKTPPPAPTATPAANTEHLPQGTGDGTGPEIVLPADGSPLPAAEIKGRMTLQEVSDLCQVPMETLVAELDLPADVDSQILLRDLANQSGVEVLTVRQVVESYQAQH